MLVTGTRSVSIWLLVRASAVASVVLQVHTLQHTRLRMCGTQEKTTNRYQVSVNNTLVGIVQTSTASTVWQLLSNLEPTAVHYVVQCRAAPLCRCRRVAVTAAAAAACTVGAGGVEGVRGRLHRQGPERHP